jgi:predicted nucleic acid-binding protein
MICGDSSVAVKWILDEERTDQARALLAATMSAGELIVAPPLMPIEVTNILRQRMRATERFSLARVLSLLADFERFPFEIHDPPGLHRLALVLADHAGLPAAYDAHSLALAQMFACTLWTDDRRLVQAAGRDAPAVRLIEEYDASLGPHNG